jgi:hypothetical protein
VLVRAIQHARPRVSLPLNRAISVKDPVYQRGARRYRYCNSIDGRFRLRPLPETAEKLASVIAEGIASEQPILLLVRSIASFTGLLI